MQLRAPAIPLITVDPYFSVWSFDKINQRATQHWTGSSNSILGTVNVDGEVFRFLGKSGHPEIKQVSLDIDAMSTTIIYENEIIKLTAIFTSPLLIDDLYYISRPVSYLKLTYEALDGNAHCVTAKISVSEELVLNKAGEGRAFMGKATVSKGVAIKMSKGEQKLLCRSGDDVRIDWGSFYLAVKGNGNVGNEVFNSLYAIYAETELNNEALFTFAYDDISSLIYFEKPVKAYWKKDGKTIEEAIAEAFDDYEILFSKCNKFSEKLKHDANKSGNEKYADMLLLSYRQVIAAHKLVVDVEGNNLYISKECFSNGCAATVDVTYPSAPLFLLYNTELLKAMLRPIIHYSRSEAWEFDFAPHDVGTYPILNGQVYCDNKLECQMPVEECGNMIIITSAICEAENSAEFALSFIDLLSKWKDYLIKYGLDPENQLCSDDFAGHLAHNCNLSIKAIMGIIGYARILRKIGENENSNEIAAIAKNYAKSFCERALNSDGSYRLAYDQVNTFSLKYNAIWDKIWNTKLFTNEFYNAEITRYKKETMPYGIPLDNREKYTKSDWTVWVASFAENKEDFIFFTDKLWNAYNTMRSRVPLTDWYYTDTSEMVGFRNRTVQGGLWIKLLVDKTNRQNN